MKKILHTIIAIVGFTGFLSAQSGVQIYYKGAGANIAGGSHEINLYATHPELVAGIYDAHFEVINNTGSAEQWRITRSEISVPASWNDQLCWPPLCYNTTDGLYTTPNTGGNPAPIIETGKIVTIGYEGDPPYAGTVTINVDGTDYTVTFNTDIATTVSDFVAAEASTILSAHGLTVTENGSSIFFNGSTLPLIEITNNTGNIVGHYPNELKPRITPDQSTGSFAHYRYYVNQGGVYIDSVDLKINFVLATNEVKPAPQIAIGPNPASETVKISGLTADSYKLKIVDVLGNTITQETVMTESRSINVSDYKNGVYFIILETAGEKAVTKRLIVRH